MPWLALALAMLSLAVADPSALAQQGRPDRPGGRPGNRGRDREGGEQSREESPPSAKPSAPTTPASTANSFGTVSEGERIRERASQMIKQHDKSGNGILEGDELEKLGMSRGADKDGDGVITRDDLIIFYTPKTSTSSTPQPASQSASTASANTGSKPDDSLKRKIVNDKRKSYRFKSTKDRANNWKFSSRDANGDGQVSMSEYSRSWSDRTAAEFLRYDKDNDGMITAAEAK